MKSESKTARFLMEDEREYRGFPRVSTNKVMAHRVDRRVSKQGLKTDIPETALEEWENDTCEQDFDSFEDEEFYAFWEAWWADYDAAH